MFLCLHCNLIGSFLYIFDKEDSFTSRYEQLASSDWSSQSILELHLFARGIQSPKIKTAYLPVVHDMLGF